MIMLYFIFFIFVFLILYAICTKKYVNPYTLNMVFGKKGSGKSTLLTKLALNYIKKGRKVYSTEKIVGTYHISPEDVGYYEFDENSVVLIDEVGMVWDNRDFKNFKTDVRDWFKLQRHRKITVYLFSQSFDVDKKIRDLCDNMYLLTKFARVFSIAKRINKKLVLNNSTAEAPSKIDEDLVFDSILFIFSGSRIVTFIPKYAKYFDSFKNDKLKEKEFEYIPVITYENNKKHSIKYISFKRVGKSFPWFKKSNRSGSDVFDSSTLDGDL